MKASYIVHLLFTQDILFVIASFRAFQTGCVCVMSWTWNNFYRMHLIHQFGSERTWTLQKLTHLSPKVTCYRVGPITHLVCLNHAITSLTN